MKMMTAHTTRRKPIPSAYQKQIRFLTGLSLVACFGIIGTFFWVINHLPYSYH